MHVVPLHAMADRERLHTNTEIYDALLKAHHDLTELRPATREGQGAVEMVRMTIVASNSALLRVEQKQADRRHDDDAAAIGEAMERAFPPKAGQD
ncbi:hypothetical protein DYI37_03125 [Fulvimarina endophytica]|uniref:Uncharacterized protein n=1 Tax=Fulvimarina endophytica TaxID=2293836 RepID=A0A371XB63_9HYPH|nr:hypothetical protein DYI37_03125 [Fulvimarina endophytica]